MEQRAAGLWNLRAENRRGRLQRAAGVVTGKLVAARDLPALLAAVLEPVDRVCLEGNNQKQADFLAKALAVFQNRRWDSDFFTIRELMTNGLLGDIASFEARWDRFRPQVAERWREQAGVGCGVLFDLGPHLIDQALCLFGMPDWLQADVFAQRPNAVVDDGFEIRMGSLRVSLGVSSLAADNALRYRVHGVGGSFRKVGLDVQEAQLRQGMSPSDASFGVEPERQWGCFVSANQGESTLIPSVRGDWGAFYRAMRASIETDAPVPVSAHEARNVLKLIELARVSNETGQRQDLGVA